MNETRMLARFVAETTFADLPGRLVENLKITVLDTFGAPLVGTRQPWAQRIVAVGRALGGAPEASVIHEGWRTDIARAGFANGVLIRRLRVRAAHRLAREQYRPARGARSVRARAPGWGRAPHCA